MLIIQSFFIATVLNHFLLLWCSVIPLAKGAQSFFDAIVLSHFSLLQPQSFPVATVLSHFRYYSTQPFLVQRVRQLSRVGHGSDVRWLG
jgi:hypothetical protein